MFWFNKYSKWPMTDRVKELLLDNVDKWVSAWDIVNKCKVLHYTNQIMILRKRWLYIKNRIEVKKNKRGDKVKSTFYMVTLKDGETK